MATSTFKILVEGYAYPGENGEFYASPTTTLVEHGDVKFIVDPGTNAEKLQEAMQKEGLKPTDLDFIFLSHYHPDHFLNIRLFPKLDIYDGSTAWKGDREDFYADYVPGTKIQMLQTPGHAPEHTSLLLQTAEQGVVCIAQDVFWWEDGKQETDSVQKLIDQPDPFASDPEALQQSRKLVLDLADWIIPGHGVSFRNPSKVLV